VAPATSGATLDAAAPDEATGGASLAAQNELFQAAVRAARRGDDEAAIREFDLLLERFPTSPLAADSLVRKFRTLARLGRAAESAAAAREYMARYPQGFAAAEAEKLLKTSPADGASGSP
jgi:outer membrane protein assembly factor BamD (BamD/ComL family)